MITNILLDALTPQSVVSEGNGLGFLLPVVLAVIVLVIVFVIVRKHKK